MGGVRRFVLATVLGVLLAGGGVGCAHRSEYRETQVREEVHEGPVRDVAPGQMVVD